MSDKRLYLLDGMPLLYRGHFIFMRNPRISSTGMNTSALYGFTNSLLQILTAGQPTHIALVFDPEGPTFRHEEYPPYKAQREAMPEDIATAIPHAFRIAEAFSIPVIRREGFEADDVIGTLATLAEQRDFTTYIVTPDKDFGQLVSARTLLYKPGKGSEPDETLGVPEILERWDIARIEQLIDILGLAGDAVDNIPGVPGIGPKTASKLIREFGSIENLLSSTARLKEKERARLEANAAQALLSKRLATIRRDVPLEIGPDDLAVRPRDDARPRAILRELEFFNLGRRIFGESFDDRAGKPAAGGTAPPSTAPARPAASAQGQLDFDLSPQSTRPQASSPAPAESSPALTDDSTAAGDAPASDPLPPPLKTLHEVPHRYHICADATSRAALIRLLSAQKEFCFDSESTGLNPMTDAMVGLSFCAAPHEAWYVPLPADRDAARAILEEFRPLFENPGQGKIGHNLKFDMGMLHHFAGIRVRGPLYDTMLAHYVIEPEQRHSMNHIARTHLRYDPVPIEVLIGPRGAGQKNMADVPVEQIAEYAAEDADVTLQLRAALDPLVRAAGAQRALDECENPLIPVLLDMESEGIRIDHQALADYSAALTGEIAGLEEQIYRAAGTRFNIASPKQLGDVLFEYMKIGGKPKKTATGQYATGEEILAALAPEHPVAALVLEYRACQKLKSTYVDTLPLAVSPVTGRIHTSYNQAVAATGRIQSQNPNLQNIPIRTERGREIRKAFVPRDDDHLLMSADYSQIELRIMAELSGDEGLRRVFEEKLDVHQATAARVNSVPLEGVTADMRRQAKMVNFGIMYGISAFGLAQRLAINRTAAQALIDQYFHQFPGVRGYMDRTIAFARQHGHVQTLLGRRRTIADINSRNGTARQAAERNAINTPIQGSAADMIKLAMIAVHRGLNAGGFRTRMLLQVHDELVFDLFKPEEADVRRLVAEAMRNALPMKTPIEVDIGAGRNWLEAH